MKDSIIKRKTKDGSYVFYNANRTYKSTAFLTEELREVAIEKYIEEQTALEKEAEARRKKEYDLTHE